MDAYERHSNHETGTTGTAAADGCSQCAFRSDRGGLAFSAHLPNMTTKKEMSRIFSMETQVPRRKGKKRPGINHGSAAALSYVRVGLAAAG